MRHEGICENIFKKNKERAVLHYGKLTNQLSFLTRFPKSGPTYRRQVVEPRHQHPMDNQLQCLDHQVENLNMTQKVRR